MATKKADITLVKSTDLERNLGRTITNNFYKYIDNFYTQYLSDKSNNFVVQSLNPMLEDLPQLKAKLIDLYNKTFGMESGVESIPDEIKAVQGALLDGLVFGFDLETQATELYTMNAKLLYGMDSNVEFIDKKVMDKNKVGEYKAFRIDVTYKEGSKSFEFKAVNHRKVLNGDTIFIPYLNILRGMKLVEHFLDSGSVLKVVQNIGGMEKVRVITKSTKVLAEFCDDPSVVEYLNCEYFPLTGMMYVPVVGAPSTTAMMTKVNIFSLDYVSKCKNMASIVKMGIYKDDNPVRTLVAENVIVQMMEKIKATSPDEYNKILKKLPHSKSLSNVEGEVTPIMLTKYLHQLSKADAEKVYSVIPGVQEEIGYKKFLLNSPKSVYKASDATKPITKQEIYKLLDNNICKILCRSSSCMLSSAICTNCNEYLSRLYGKDYYGKYESLGARCSAMLEEYRQGRPAKDCCKDYCIDFNAFTEIVNTPEFEGMSSDEFKSVYAKKMGIRTRSSNNSSDSPNINVRQCFATRTEEGTVTDYYKSINVSQILQIGVLND